VQYRQIITLYFSIILETSKLCNIILTIFWKSAIINLQVKIQKTCEKTTKGGKNMRDVHIKLSTIDDVKKFVNIVFRYEYDVDVVSGRYAVDAKSILGLFSIDLSKEVLMRVHSNDCDELLNELKAYIV